MQQAEQAPFKPRKRPVQARSEATVSAIFEASIQVLLAVGYRKLTTTRVAERAGVSVGTLYQYFPNRQSLMSAVIENYLDDIASSVERDCRPLMGQSLKKIVAGLVDAIIAAKCRRIEFSRAMQEPLADIGGQTLVKAAANRSAGFVAAILANCQDANFGDVDRVAALIVTSCRSLLQAAIAANAGAAELAALRTHMQPLVLGYLKEMRVTSHPRRSKGRSGSARARSALAQ